MFKFTTNVVSIEGPDCSGKTTLYSGIHKKTNFKWNIRDRSFLSTLCYAKQYNRDTSSPLRGLEKEISDLNNRIIILLPPKEVVSARLQKRGDDFQDAKSILELHDIFEEEAKKIESFPNVLLIKDPVSTDDMIMKCVSWLESFENTSPIFAGRTVRDAAVSAGGEIAACLSVDFSKNEDFSDVMTHPREGKYYSEILQETTKIFRDEINGENPYGIPQGLDSRRFYYSSSSCLSSVHFLIRNGLLKVYAQLRSTDVHRNASIDLKFLCHLSTYVCNFYDLPVENIEMIARFNCAHVRSDLEKWTKNEEIE